MCADGRFTGECGTLIADILETINLENIEGYFFLAIDFEKLITVLEKYGFEQDCTDWIKILLKNQKFCYKWWSQKTLL